LEPIPDHLLAPEVPTTRVFPCLEEDCLQKGTTFHSRSALLEHNKGVHLGIKNYQCQVNGYVAKGFRIYMSQSMGMKKGLMHAFLKV
jgi:hypothetical protein